MARTPNQQSLEARGAAGHPELPFSAKQFRAALHAWYRVHARRLPWRVAPSAYGTWLSEIMLQQTRVATVIDRYRAFLMRFPTIAALAAADEADVLALWSGLGYYRRARMLHRGAQFVMRELGGELPRTAAELRSLPGVGDYTSAAIASIAFGESVAVLDGNVERVLLRLLGLAEQTSSAARGRLKRAAQALMPRRGPKGGASNPPGLHNQAMMELGATVCLPRGPLCLECPVAAFCATRGEHVTVARPAPQSRAVAHLLAVRKNGTATEVLLERRAADASLMHNMLELPPLPLEAVFGREPALRLRHSITNTNYYVQIFTEGALTEPGAEAAERERAETSYEEDLFVAENAAAPIAEALEEPKSLLAELTAQAQALEWHALGRLDQLPLTGLARKTLQRLKLMKLPTIRLG